MLVHQSCQIGCSTALKLNISSIFLMGSERFIPGIEYTMRKEKEAKAVKGEKMLIINRNI